MDFPIIVIDEFPIFYQDSKEYSKAFEEEIKLILKKMHLRRFQISEEAHKDIWGY